MCFQRATACASRSGSTRRSRGARASVLGSETTYDGERCSIVTCAARSAIAGTMVTAVAPEPITSTRRPDQSRSSGQNCGCTTSPP